MKAKTNIKGFNEVFGHHKPPEHQCVWHRFDRSVWNYAGGINNILPKDRFTDVLMMLPNMSVQNLP